MSLRSRRQLLVAILIAMVVGTALMPRIAQDPVYHRIADQRALLGIPHFLDVVSNVPFFFIGLWGLWTLRRNCVVEPGERWPYAVLFIGVAFTCFGSAYYHWEPNNKTLVWDRLPMTIGFMGLLAAMINERVSTRLGTRLLVPLLIVGFGSVFYWQRTEVAAHGDLRPYILVQFGSVLLLLLLTTMFPASYTRGKLIGGAIAFYGLAKLLEMADVPIFRMTGGTVSGHTLKHLAAAGAIVWIVEMLQAREAISRNGVLAQSSAL